MSPGNSPDIRQPRIGKRRHRVGMDSMGGIGRSPVRLREFPDDRPDRRPEPAKRKRLSGALGCELIAARGWSSETGEKAALGGSARSAQRRAARSSAGADVLDEGQDFAMQEGLGDERLDLAAAARQLHRRVVAKEIAGDQDDEKIFMNPAQLLD